MLAKATPEEVRQEPAPTREKIQQLQEAMLELRTDMPEPEHFFAPGMYGRRLPIPAGMLVVGKTHKHAHLMMVLQGKAEIVTEFGRDLVEAGHISVSQPGAKRVVLTLEDTVFVTVHHNPDDVEDLEIIEKNHIEDEDFKLEYHEDIRRLSS